MHTFGRKAVAINAVSLIVIIAAFLFVTVAIFLGWINIQNLEANRVSCAAKLLNYCTDWWKKQFQSVPYSWADQPPNGCENDPIKIGQPTAEDCKNILRLS